MTASLMVSLASSVHAGPGTFALLLGSGISVSAGVPSGWGVMVELIRRLAVLRRQDAGDDPVSRGTASRLAVSPTTPRSLRSWPRRRLTV